MYLAQRMFRNTQTQSVNGSWVGKQDFNEEKEYIPLENLYPWLLMEPHNKKTWKILKTVWAKEVAQTPPVFPAPPHSQCCGLDFLWPETHVLKN